MLPLFSPLIVSSVVGAVLALCVILVLFVAARPLGALAALLLLPSIMPEDGRRRLLCLVYRCFVRLRVYIMVVFRACACAADVFTLIC